MTVYAFNLMLSQRGNPSRSSLWHQVEIQSAAIKDTISGFSASWVCFFCSSGRSGGLSSNTCHVLVLVLITAAESQAALSDLKSGNEMIFSCLLKVYSPFKDRKCCSTQLVTQCRLSAFQLKHFFQGMNKHLLVMLIFNVVLFTELNHATEMLKRYRCKAEPCAEGFFFFWSTTQHSVTGGRDLVALQSPVLVFNYHNLI